MTRPFKILAAIWTVALPLSVGLELRTDPMQFWRHERFFSECTFFLTWIAGWVLIFLYRNQVKLLPLGTALVALFLSGHYLVGTATIDRQNDPFEHMQYISHVLQHHKAPPPARGGESYHPPLYYFIAAGWLGTIEKFFGPYDPYSIVQILGLILFWVTIGVSVKVFTDSERLEKAPWLGVVIFMLITAHLFLAGRVNNDVLLPLLGALSVWAAQLYWQKGRWIYIFWGSLIGLAAFFVKFSGVVLWTGFLWCVLLSPKKKDKLWHFFGALIPGLTALAIWMIYSFRETGRFLYTNINSVDPRDPLYVANTLSKFLFFNLKAFLTEPYDLITGQMKNSIFTEMAVTLVQGPLPNGANATFLLFYHASFLPIILTFLFFFRRKTLKSPLGLLALGYFMSNLGFYILFNLKQPLACSQDGRYLAPIFFCLGIMISLGFKNMQDLVPRPYKYGFTALALVYPLLLPIFYWQIIYIRTR